MRYGPLLATIAISMFLDGMDCTVVNVATPVIADRLAISTGDASWIVTSYLLVMSGLILVFGRMCDTGAIKRVLIAGMTVFTLGSLACGFSPTLSALIAGRCFQGVGGAMLAASAVMLGVKFLPKEKLGLGMSLVVLGTSAGVAIGPTVGAVITECVSWNWIFFINVPIGIAAVTLAHVSVPRDSVTGKMNLDLPGSTMLFAAIVCGLYAIERIPSSGLTTVGMIALVVCAILLIAYVVHSLHVPNPVLNPRLFRNRNFDFASLSYVIVNAVIVGSIYLIPFLFSIVCGIDTLESGLLLSLQAVSMVACCSVVARYSCRENNRIFATVACIILTAFALLSLRINGDSAVAYIAVTMLACGAVWGIGGGPMGARIIDSLKDDERGSGSAVVSFIMYFSSAFGTALFAGMFGLVSGEGIVSDVSSSVFLNGFGVCMLTAAVLSAVAASISFVLGRNKANPI